MRWLRARDLPEALVYGIAMALSCLVSFWIDTAAAPRLPFVNQPTVLLGGMWAVIATVFVFRYSFGQSVAAALSRMVATTVSLVLCLLYLLVLPFSPVGMAALIAVGAIIMTVAGRREDTVTVGITTAVVMVVAALDPKNAWLQPILRFADTVVGVAVGVTAAWIGATLVRLRRPAPTRSG
jgi:uncharacterized membrane protein YccC